MASAARTEETEVSVKVSDKGVAICAYVSEGGAYVHLPKDTQKALRDLLGGRRSCTTIVRARLTPSEGKCPWVLGKSGLRGLSEQLDVERDVDRDRLHAEVEVSLGTDGRVVRALRISDKSHVYVGRSALSLLVGMASPLPAVLHLMVILERRDGSWCLYSAGVGRLLKVERPEWEEIQVAVEIPPPSRCDGRSLVGQVVGTGLRLRFEDAAARSIIELLGGRPGMGRVKVCKPRAVHRVEDPAQIVGLAGKRG
jgi:hypothetical protein